MADPLRHHLSEGELLRRRSFNRLMRWDSDLPQELVEQFWHDPPSLLKAGQTLQDKPRCKVVRLDHPAGPFVFKSHNWGGIRKTLRKSWRRSSAEKTWTDGLFLHAAGIPTPRPRAYLERRWGPLSSRSFLLTDYVEGTSLYRYMRFQNPAEPEIVHDLASQVAEIWQQLDDLSVCHNDLKAENLLIDPDDRVWLIDLERMGRYRRQEKVRRKQVRDAADLLHPRNWRSNPAAAEVFRQQILKTRSGTAATAGLRAAKHPLNRPILATNRSSQLVTVVIACRNDAQAIAPCIESLRDIADEILVADFGSTDNLAEIVSDLGGCRLFQKQRGSELEFETWIQQQAQHPWILRILPSERLHAELGKQIQDLLATEPADDGFRITRRYDYWGQPLEYGGFQNDAPVRLYRRDVGRIELRDGLAEVMIPSGKIGQIMARLNLEVCNSVEQHLNELLRQSIREAETAQQQGRPAKRRNVLLKASWQFLRSYLLQSGWLDGRAGLHASWLSAFAICLRETKLWEMQRAHAAQAQLAESQASLRIFTPETTANADILALPIPTRELPAADEPRQQRAAA